MDKIGPMTELIQKQDEIVEIINKYIKQYDLPHKHQKKLMKWLIKSTKARFKLEYKIFEAQNAN